jgi:hypothetical protein
MYTSNGLMGEGALASMFDIRKLSLRFRTAA